MKIIKFIVDKLLGRKPVPKPRRRNIHIDPELLKQTKVGFRCTVSFRRRLAEQDPDLSAGGFCRMLAERYFEAKDRLEKEK